MKFHYMGKYDGNPDSLPTREHEPGYVPFKEPSAEKLPLVINLIALAVSLVLAAPVIILKFEALGSTVKSVGFIGFMAIWISLCIAPMILIIPHEFLHGLCFKGDVYMYTNMKQGICFVIGPEMFSKTRFIFMSLLPSIVFGAIPYIIWIIFPDQWYIGALGAITTGMGGGDFMNVVNALVQMPRGAKTYMHGMNSFWVKQARQQG